MVRKHHFIIDTLDECVTGLITLSFGSRLPRKRQVGRVQSRLASIKRGLDAATQLSLELNEEVHLHGY